MVDSKIHFKGQIAVPLQFGHYLEIDVQTIDFAKSVNLSLLNDKNSSTTIEHGLRISLQLEENELAANNFRDSELISTSKIKNLIGTIKLNLFICETAYYISINGKKRIRIKFGLEINQLNCVQIDGDVKQIASFNHRKAYPSIWPPCILGNAAQNSFTLDRPTHFQDGNLLILQAQLYGPQKGGGFQLLIRHLFSEAELFIFNVQFDEKVVTCNALFPPYYGEEESYSGYYFPFSAELPFSIGILFKARELLIAVNGNKCCRFALRNPEEYPLSSFGSIRLIGYQNFSTVIKVTDIEHMQLSDSQQLDFEKYTKIEHKLKNNETPVPKEIPQNVILEENTKIEELPEVCTPVVEHKEYKPSNFVKNRDKVTGVFKKLF